MQRHGQFYHEKVMLCLMIHLEENVHQNTEYLAPIHDSLMYKAGMSGVWQSGRNNFSNAYLKKKNAANLIRTCPFLEY